MPALDVVAGGLRGRRDRQHWRIPWTRHRCGASGWPRSREPTSSHNLRSGSRVATALRRRFGDALARRRSAGAIAGSRSASVPFAGARIGRAAPSSTCDRTGRLGLQRGRFVHHVILPGSRRASRFMNALSTSPDRHPPARFRSWRRPRSTQALTMSANVGVEASDDATAARSGQGTFGAHGARPG